MRKPWAGPGRTVVAVVVAAIIAGCGGGGSTKSTTASTTAGDSAAQGSDEFCGLIKTYSDRLAGLSQASATPAQIQSFAKDLGSAIKSAVAAAPADIKADATVVAGAADDYLASLESANYDMAKLPPDAAQGFQAPDVAAAAARLQTYSHDVCHTRN